MPGLAVAERKKLGSYDFYREVLGSPKFVVAPMVDQSELVCFKNADRPEKLTPSGLEKVVSKIWCPST